MERKRKNCENVLCRAAIPADDMNPVLENLVQNAADVEYAEDERVLLILVRTFRGKEDALVPKEVVLVSVLDKTKQHWTVRPPYSREELPLIARARNSMHWRSITWESGICEQSSEEAQIEKSIRDATLVLCEESETFRYLTERREALGWQPPRDIRSLNEFVIPEYATLSAQYGCKAVGCIEHREVLQKCALVKVNLVFLFIQDLFEPDEELTIAAVIHNLTSYRHGFIFMLQQAEASDEEDDLYETDSGCATADELDELDL